MPLYMDIHKVPGVTAEDLAKAHAADLKVQGKYGVEYLKYWVNESCGKVFCLVHAPSPEAATLVHREAHGLVAEKIIEVEPEVAEGFLGGGETNPSGAVLLAGGAGHERDPGIRTVLFTEIVDLTMLTQRLGDEAAMALLHVHDSIVRDALAASGGREVKHTGDGIMACFASAAAAVRCATLIQLALVRNEKQNRAYPVKVRIGAAAGEPVEHHHDLFGSTVQLAARLCTHAQTGQVLVSNVVAELCIGKGLLFKDQGEAFLTGFDRPIRVHAVGWSAEDAEQPRIAASALADGRPYPFLDPPRGAGELGWLGSYQLIRVLGSGGMGIVFAAEDTSLNRVVALKVLRPEFAADPAKRSRFVFEARTTAAIEHENVVAIYAVGEHGPTPYLVMPLLKGESLEERLKREPWPTLREACQIGLAAAAGLTTAHDRGVIHRDIKPSNIWLEAVSGRVKVLDFGLAKAVDSSAEHLTQSGAVLGTPAYMAPEQAAGRKVDAKTDLFSLGCVLYQLTTGQRPFKGPTVMAILTALATHQPRPPQEINPSIPPALSQLVVRLLAKDPKDRPGSAQAVIAELDKILTDAEVGLQTSPTVESPDRPILDMASTVAPEKGTS